MVFSTSILYVTPGMSGSGHTHVTPQWTNYRFFINDGTNLYRYSLLSSALQASEALATYGSTTEQPIGLDGNGNLYLVKGGLSEGGAFQVNGGTLALENTLTYSVNTFGGGGWATSLAGTTQYVVDVGVGGAIIGPLSQSNVLKSFTQSVNQNFPQIRNAYALAGKIGSQRIYALFYPGTSGDPQTITIQTMVPGSPPTLTTTATLVPTDIDAGWTQIYLDSAAVDQADGLIVGVFRGQSGASKVAKINPASGAVSWSTALGVNVSPGQPFAYSRIISSRLCIATSGPNTITTVDTSAGTIATYTTNLAGLTILGTQSYWDDQGAILLRCQFSQTAGSPTLLGTTPTTFTGWALLYVAAGVAPPPASAGRKFLAELGPVKL